MPTDSPTPDAAGGGGETEKEERLETFVVSSSHQTTPADILLEVAFSGGGGGGEPVCWEYYGFPTEVSPLQEYQDLPVELVRDSLSSFTCGWQSGESVRITLRFPDGQSLVEDKIAAKSGEDFGLGFSYNPGLSDPPGEYLLTFSGASGSVTTHRRVIEPSEPRILFDPDDERGQKGPGTLWLYCFVPQEHVRLFAYQDLKKTGVKGRLIGWQEVQVDVDGQLRITVDPGAYEDIVHYTAVGDVSGEAVPYAREIVGYFPVLGASILNVNYVIPKVDSAVFDPTGYCTSDGPIVGYVMQSERLEVSGSQRIYDGTLWWIVRLDDGTEGCLADDLVEQVAE